jgi:hypothetical protein
LETFRCPTCLFVLADPGRKRCPSCHKRLRRRGKPIVLGNEPKRGNEPTINLVLDDRVERLGAPPERWAAAAAEPIETRFVDRPDEVPAVTSSVLVPPVFTTPPVAPGAVTEHTTIFEPSQFDPEMRRVLDDLYRKARSASDD